MSRAHGTSRNATRSFSAAYHLQNGFGGHRFREQDGLCAGEHGTQKMTHGHMVHGRHHEQGIVFRKGKTGYLVYRRGKEVLVKKQYGLRGAGRARGEVESAFVLIPYIYGRSCRRNPLAISFSMASKSPNGFSPVQMNFWHVGSLARIPSILSAYSSSKRKQLGSAAAAQYRIFSSVKRKLRGFIQAPVFIMEKNASSQVMEFFPSQKTLSPFLTPRAISALARRLVLSLNCFQVVSSPHLRDRPYLDKGGIVRV